MDDDSATTNKGSAGKPPAADSDGDSRDAFCQDVMNACKKGDLDLAGTVFQVLRAIVKVRSAHRKTIRTMRWAT